MPSRREPLRMCLGCSQMLPKSQLCRVVKNKENEISLDFTGKAAGRGAYVCKNIDCLKAARKARRFERALSAQIPDEVYNAMEREMTENGE